MKIMTRGLPQQNDGKTLGHVCWNMRSDYGLRLNFCLASWSVQSQLQDEWPCSKDHSDHSAPGMTAAPENAGNVIIAMGHQEHPLNDLQWQWYMTHLVNPYHVIVPHRFVWKWGTPTILYEYPLFYFLYIFIASPCELSKKGGWRHSIVDRAGLEVEHLKNGAPSSKEFMGQSNIS